MSDPDALEPEPGEPIAGFEPHKLRDVEPTDLAIRFAFGAGVSIVASLAGQVWSPLVGGLFLAFPAILPATLTLLEQKHGTDHAVHDVRGALLGSLGLVAFAVVGAALFERTSAVFVLAGATAAWIAVSVGVYMAVAAWRQEHKQSRPERSADAEEMLQ